MTFMLFSEETEVEILLSCYQTNEAVRELRYPADVPTSVELGALLAQIEWGNARDFDVRSCCCWHVVLITQDMSGMVSELISRFVPQVRGLHCRAVNAIRMTQGAFKTAPLNTPDSQTRLVAAENAAVEQQITEAWLSLHKIGPLECARFGFWSSYCCFISNTHRAYCEIVNVWPYARAGVHLELLFAVRTFEVLWSERRFVCNAAELAALLFSVLLSHVAPGPLLVLTST
jgi:hypothetical protein